MEHILLGPGAVDLPGVSIGMEVEHRLVEGTGSNAKGHEKCLMHSRRHRMGKNDRRAHMLVETTKVPRDPRGVFREPLGPLRCVVDGPAGQIDPDEQHATPYKGKILRTGFLVLHAPADGIAFSKELPTIPPLMKMHERARPVLPRLLGILLVGILVVTENNKRGHVCATERVSNRGTIGTRRGLTSREDVTEVNEKLAFGLCVRLIDILAKLDGFPRFVRPATHGQECDCPGGRIGLIR